LYFRAKTSPRSLGSVGFLVRCAIGESLLDPKSASSSKRVLAGVRGRNLCFDGQGDFWRGSGFLLGSEDSVSLSCSSLTLASRWLRRTMAEVFTEPDCPATSRI
jgi:hypothetical protein